LCTLQIVFMIMIMINMNTMQKFKWM